MITKEELLKNCNFDDLDSDIQQNIEELLIRVNKIRTLWAKPMKVTSGLRTIQDHLRIYKSKGITDLAKIPMKSLHLSGRAVDIFDPKLELTAWLKQHPEILEEIGLWCEEGNSNWVHFQIVPPKSGKRWFLP